MLADNRFPQAWSMRFLQFFLSSSFLRWRVFFTLKIISFQNISISNIFKIPSAFRAFALVVSFFFDIISVTILAFFSFFTPYAPLITIFISFDVSPFVFFNIKLTSFLKRSVPFSSIAFPGSQDLWFPILRVNVEWNDTQD